MKIDAEVIQIEGRHLPAASSTEDGACIFEP